MFILAINSKEIPLGHSTSQVVLSSVKTQFLDFKHLLCDFVAHSVACELRSFVEGCALGELVGKLVEGEALGEVVSQSLLGDVEGCLLGLLLGLLEGCVLGKAQGELL